MQISRLAEKLLERQVVRQLMKFSVTTGFSACLSFGMPIALVELLSYSQRSAVIIGFVCSYLFNIIVIRSFVFGSRAHWVRDIAIYVVMNGALRALEFVVFLLLLEWLGVYYAAALFIVLAMATITKFFAYRYVFR